jgi:hypothetical protein
MVKAFNQDIMDWEAFPEYDIICTDPPWQQQALSMFQTMLKKNTGIQKYHTINEILNQLGKLSDTKKPCIIAYSVKGQDLLIQSMVSNGHTLNAVYERTQSMGRPYVIMVFNDFNNTIHIPDLKGYALITESLKQIGCTGIAFDPFAGIGQTANAVQKAGWQYIGSEINAARFAKLIKVIK